MRALIRRTLTETDRVEECDENGNGKTITENKIS